METRPSGLRWGSGPNLAVSQLRELIGVHELEQYKYIDFYTFYISKSKIICTTRKLKAEEISNKYYVDKWFNTISMFTLNVRVSP